MSDNTQPIEFYQDTYQRKVGGLDITIGVILMEGRGNQAYLYAAALEKPDLRRERCGYGVTEAEAVADLFRYMRPAAHPLLIDF